MEVYDAETNNENYNLEKAIRLKYADPIPGIDDHKFYNKYWEVEFWDISFASKLKFPNNGMGLCGQWYMKITSFCIIFNWIR